MAKLTFCFFVQENQTGRWVGGGEWFDHLGGEVFEEKRGGNGKKDYQKILLYVTNVYRTVAIFLNTNNDFLWSLVRLRFIPRERSQITVQPGLAVYYILHSTQEALEEI